jgi:hypothetical protein
MTRLLLAIATATLPGLVSAQSVPLAPRAEIDALLATSNLDSVAAGLGEAFAAHVFDLVPELTVEQREAIEEAVAEGFDRTTVREDIAAALAADAPAHLVATMVQAHRTGAIAELARLAAAYTPPQSIAEFTAALRTAPLPRERLQLMVALAEARGDGDFGLNVDEGVRKVAHELVVVLGGTTEPFAPLPDADFEALYQSRTRVQTVVLLHRYATASDDLIRRATAEHDSEAGRWYVESYMAAITGAAAAAGSRVAALTVADPEPAPQPEAAPTVAAVDPRVPCRAVACNLYVEWSGRPPVFNQTFGNAEDLESRVFERLLSAGYQIARRMQGEGITIRVRPRIVTGLCGFMSGTDNRGCPAIDQVTVEFTGAIPGVQNPTNFTLQNRCGSDGLLDVNGFGLMVAARLDYALTTFTGDTRQLPRC